MTNEKHIAEENSIYQALTVDLSKPIIIEHEGQPIAVIMAYAEYKRLKAIQADSLRQREEALNAGG